MTSGRSRIRMAVVGLGRWGRHHARILAQMDEVTLAGVVDRDAREVRLHAQRFETRPFVDHHHLLGDVDGVVVAVPTALHYEIASEFLAAGAHVLVEKPIADNADDGQRLVAQAARADRALLVGHIERFKPAVQRLFALVSDPLAIQARRARPYDARRTMDVGVMMDLMIHDIDIVQAMLPDRFEDLRAIGVAVLNSHEDLAVAHLRTSSGCAVALTASRIAATKAVDMEVTMADRSVHLDFLRQTVTVRHIGGETQREVVDGQETLRLELSHFVDCIRGETRPLVTGEDGVRALRVAEDLRARMIQISPPLRV